MMDEAINISRIFDMDFPVRLYKKCGRCRKYFPSVPLNIEKYCPNCRNKHSRWGYLEEDDLTETVQVYYLESIKKDRFIPFDVFDLYDLRHPIRDYNGEKIVDYERVCRICGARLLKKDGAHNSVRRFCENPAHNGDEMYEKYSWTGARNKYISDLQDAQWLSIKYFINNFRDDLKPSPWNYSSYLFCEDCGSFTPITSYKAQEDQINIHHVKPIHTLSHEELSLIFDPNNLICLCEKCHHERHKNKKKKPLPDPNSSFKKISEFL